MAKTQTAFRKEPTKKKTRQGASQRTMTGKKKGTIKKYRGQGGPKSRKH